MIGRISGQLLEKNPPQIVVDVNGIGYEIDVPMSTFTTCLLQARRSACIPTSRYAGRTLPLRFRLRR